MKRLLTFLFCTLLCAISYAKPPQVVVDEPQVSLESKIVVVNDSTIIYYNVYGIQVAQPNDVYTGIFEYNLNKKKPMKLVTMNSGAYIWTNRENQVGTYILYASKAFDKVILRAKEE